MCVRIDKLTSCPLKSVHHHHHHQEEEEEDGEEGNDGTTKGTKNYYKVATFAGGCFWGLELAYQRVPGVAYTAAGYTQGNEKEPNYDMVCAGYVRFTFKKKGHY